MHHILKYYRNNYLRIFKVRFLSCFLLARLVRDFLDERDLLILLCFFFPRDVRAFFMDRSKASISRFSFSSIVNPEEEEFPKYRAIAPPIKSLICYHMMIFFILYRMV